MGTAASLKEIRASALRSIVTVALLIVAAVLLVHLFATPELGLAELLAHALAIAVAYSLGFTLAYVAAHIVWSRFRNGPLPLWLAATACVAGLAFGLVLLAAAPHVGLAPASGGHAEAGWLLRLTPVGAVLILAFLVSERTRQLRAELAATAKLRWAPPDTRPWPIELTGSAGITIVDARDIAFAGAQENYCEVVLRNGRRILMRSTLAGFHERLPAEQFARTHRSFVVNLDCLDSIAADGRAYRAQLTALEPAVPVSRAFAVDVANAWRRRRSIRG